MAEPAEAWDEVGAKFHELGGRLRSHFGPAPEGTHAPGASDELRDALRSLGAALDSTFNAVANAAKDPAVTSEVRDVGQSLVNALSATFGQVGDELRKAFSRQRPPAEGADEGGHADAGEG